jgi:hypothetical protein
VSVALCLASCNTTQFLNREVGEAYLVKNSVVFEKPASGKVKNKASLTYELAKLYLQKPNRKFFFVPRQYFYFSAQDTFDRSKIGVTWRKWVSKTFGEEPSLLDTAMIRETAKTMRNYLQNRGYFFAEVGHEVKLNKKETKASVTYRVAPDGRFTIDTLIFDSRDTAIKRILNEIAPASFLKPGSPIDVKLYEQEVARITKHLRNNGYAYFYPQYVSNLEGIDSSNLSKSAGLKLEVLTPPGKEAHRTYTVGNIYVNPNFDPATAASVRPDTLIEDVFFTLSGGRFRVRPRTLTNSIYFKTGEQFSQEELDNTVRQLGALGVFRPPTVRFEEDTLHEGVLNFYILLTPNKKWEFGSDFNISMSQGLTSGNLLGLSFSPSLRNRNFLRGAELLIGNIDMGTELALFSRDTINTSIINTIDLRLQGDIYMPRFADYFSLWKNLNRVHLVGDGLYEKMRRRATTRLSSGYNLLRVINRYQLQFINFAYGYDLQLSLTDRLIINHFGVDFLVPRFEPAFEDQVLEEQPFLRRSLSKQFITGLIFRDLNYIYTTPPTSTGTSWYFRSYFDVSGLEAWAANSLYNTITKKTPDFEFFNVDFSHYVKLELDGRRYWQFNPTRMFVARLNAGIALPYYHSETVPYVKQFFVGGPQSIRGWYARGLGPGLYKDPRTDDPRQRNQFYQAADFKIEFNLEYRFHLMRPFGLFNLYGAFFLDGGNIWTLEADTSRVGAQLAWNRKTNENGTIVQDNFLREMALATGFGTRWDFTYFIFRLDFGFPLRNNYPDPARNNTYFIDFSRWKLTDFTLQLGLGYPF